MINTYVGIRYFISVGDSFLVRPTERTEPRGGRLWYRMIKECWHSFAVVCLYMRFPLLQSTLFPHRGGIWYSGVARNTPLHTQFREKVPLLLGYVGVQEYQGKILILADPGACRVRKRTKTWKAQLKMAESRQTDYLKLDMIELAPNRNTYYVKPGANDLSCNCCRHWLSQSGELQSELIHVSPWWHMLRCYLAVSSTTKGPSTLYLSMAMNSIKWEYMRHIA